MPGVGTADGAADLIRTEMEGSGVVGEGTSVKGTAVGTGFGILLGTAVGM